MIIDSMRRPRGRWVIGTAALTVAGLTAVAVVTAATPGSAADPHGKKPRAQSREVTGAPGFVSDAHRLLDTRTNTAGPSGPISGYVPVVTTDDVPAGAAVTLSITAVGASGAGYVQAYPNGTAAPATSSLDYAAGQTISAPAVVTVPADGTVAINVAGAPTNLIVDQVGYANSGDFVASSPVRLADTRTSGGARTGTITVPVGERAVGSGVVAVTVIQTDATGPGYVALADSDGPTSVVNYARGTILANLAYTTVAENGTITLTVAGAPTNVIVDLDGYAPDGAVVDSGSATRIADSRTGVGLTKGPVSGTQTIDLGDVPSDVTAVAVNVTTDVPSAPGYVVGYAGATVPGISELQYLPRAQRANLLVVPVVDGKITLYFRTPTQAVVDLEAAFGTVGGSPTPSTSVATSTTTAASSSTTTTTTSSGTTPAS